MKQDPRSQVPGVDLSFSDGRHGRIWGIAGLPDRGKSFQKAAAYLRSKADQEDVIEWVISIELDIVVTAAFKGILSLIICLDELVREKPDRRSIRIEWRAKPHDDNMNSVFRDMKIALKRKASPGLELVEA